jgi:hypothetical protein
MGEVDQVAGGIGEERLPAVGARPARRRIGGRDELRRHLGRGAERRVIQHRQILVDRALDTSGTRPWAPYALPTAGIGLDQAAVDRHPVAAHQALGHAAAHHRLEHVAQKIAVAQAAMAVLREGRMIWHLARQAEPTEPIGSPGSDGPPRTAGVPSGCRSNSR